MRSRTMLGCGDQVDGISSVQPAGCGAVPVLTL